MTGIHITIDGKPIPGVTSIAITTDAATVLRVQPGGLADAAKAAPAGATILLAPGVYREAVAFDRPVTLQAEGWAPGGKPSVLIDATGLPLPERKAALLFRAPATVRGLEVTGAASPDGNGAGIRNYPGVDLAIEDCDLHGCETNVLVSGGRLILTRCDLHHNTGDGNCHLVYYAAAMPGGELIATDSRFYHSPNGSCVKSRALKTTLLRCWVGSISVPAGTPGLLPRWGAMNPAPPGGGVWLGDHSGCNCGGEACASGAIDIPDGGDVSITDSVLCSATTRQRAVYRYAFESTKNGAFDQVITRTLISKQCATGIGNRAPGTTLVLADCAITGDATPGGFQWGAVPMTLDLGPATLKPRPVVQRVGSTPVGG